MSLTSTERAIAAPPAAVVTTQRAAAIRQAALMLRCIAADQVARGQRDPTCFVPALADVLEMVADGMADEARHEMRRWAQVARAMDGGR